MNTAAGARKPKRRAYRWIAVLLLLVVVAYAIRASWKSEPEVQYNTVQADRGDVVARVTATGTLSALVTVQVGSQVSGRIQELNVDFNSQVKKGQLIAKIDPRLFEAEVEQQRANLQAAEANLTRAKVLARDARRQAERANELVGRGLVSQSERDTTQANADSADSSVVSAQASVSQARASLNRAQVNLNYTNILSPTDGVVISRSVDVGQTVAASLQAPVLFTIAQDLRQMQVNTSVSESDVGKLAADMPATFTVDAYPGERFRGKVRQVRDAATTNQNVVTYDAVLDVENPDLKLKPGMTANVTFIYAQKRDVLRVPNAALRFRLPAAQGKTSIAAAGAAAGGQAQATSRMQGEGARQRSGGAEGGNGNRPRRPRGEESANAPRSLWVLRAGQPVEVQVRTGISDGSVTEITELLAGELNPGDELISDIIGGDTGDKPAARGPGMRLF